MAKRSTFPEFVIKANNVHGENKYIYPEQEYINGTIKLKIICHLHGEFSQSAQDHLAGYGCHICGGTAKLNTKTFIKKAKLIHLDNNYNYDKVVYISAHKKIIIICTKHGEFSQKPGSHLHGRGCKKCGYEKLSLLISSNTNIFIEKAILVHPDKNYNYDEVIYTNSKAKIIVICPEHGKFYQTPNRHLMGDGCPKCGFKHGIKEAKFLDLIGVPENKRQIIIPNTKYKVDGIIDNIIYEFNGDFWHGNPQFYNQNKLNRVTKEPYGELYQKTLQRKMELENLGYIVVSIWESDFDHYINYCKSHLNQCSSIYTEYLIPE